MATAGARSASGSLVLCISAALLACISSLNVCIFLNSVSLSIIASSAVPCITCTMSSFVGLSRPRVVGTGAELLGGGGSLFQKLSGGTKMRLIN